MKKIVILIVVLMLVLFVGCKTQVVEKNNMVDVSTIEDKEVMEDKITYMDVSVAKAKELIDTKPNLIVIDVSPKYSQGHLPRAINYYLGDGSLESAIPSLDPNAEYLVYCHVDSVAIAGAQKLIDAGFKTVYRLEGNYGAWVSAGYPVE